MKLLFTTKHLEKVFQQRSALSPNFHKNSDEFFISFGGGIIRFETIVTTHNMLLLIAFTQCVKKKIISRTKFLILISHYCNIKIVGKSLQKSHKQV
jgi:hypothetical protein